MKGFIKLNRSDEAMNLQHNMCANHLFYIIALRASRKGNPVLGLKPGDAMLGDYKNYGMTRQQYRTALKNLCEWGYIKLNLTNKGTIATICTTDVYDLNFNEPNHQTTIQQPSSNHQTTIQQPSDNHQVTTNNNNKNINNINNEIIKENKFFVFEKIENYNLLTLEDYEKEAAHIVLDYYKKLGFKPKDFCVFTVDQISDTKKEDYQVYPYMETLNKAFLTYIYKLNIHNIQSLQVHLKSVQNNRGMRESIYNIKPIIQAVRTATENKYKKIYFDIIK